MNVALKETPILENLKNYFSNKSSLMVGIAFWCESALFATWLAHIPNIKRNLELSEGQLGIALFGLPLGLLILNPFCARINKRFGSANACLMSGVFCCLCMIVPAFAPNIYILFAGLVGVGMGSALINVAINDLASSIEKIENKRILATCHGMWSLGGMMSGFLASFLIQMGVQTKLHVTVMAFVIATIYFLIKPTLDSIAKASLAIAKEEDNLHTKFIFPDKNFTLIILVGTFGMMTEGLAFDWSGVYLREVVQTSPQVSALGFSFFAAAMTLARFTGDAIIPAIGEKKVLFFGSILACLGLSLLIIFPTTQFTLLGFLLQGLGCALGAPILFTASMRMPNVSPAAGLATYATFSFLGFLVGPPLIGFISEHFGLQIGFAFVAFCLFSSAMLVKWIRL